MRAFIAGTHIISNNVLLETFFSAITRTEKYTPQTERGRNEDFFADIITGTWSGGAFGEFDGNNTLI